LPRPKRMIADAGCVITHNQAATSARNEIMPP
jgi:hypothetical protein